MGNKPPEERVSLCQLFSDKIRQGDGLRSLRESVRLTFWFRAFLTNENIGSVTSEPQEIYL